VEGGGVSDILYRAELHTPDQARALLSKHALPWIGEQLHQGRELVAEIRLLDDDITDKQRAYLHSVVLTEISLYAYRPGGQRFDMKTWKEYFRSEWLGFKTVTWTNPLTGKKHRRRERISTEDLGIRKMAEYIDRIIAFAATDLGLTISEPLPPELRPGRRKSKPREVIDADTGEITQEEACTTSA
jgi:hypothetical protein